MQAVRDVGEQPKQARATDLYIAGRLRMARKLAKLSQEQLAEAMGVTSQQVQKYEKGLNRLSASRLYELAQILGQPVAFFLPPAPVYKPRPGTTAESAVCRLRKLMSAPETTNLLSAFLRIEDSKVRHHVVGLVRSIANDPNERH